MHGHGLDGTSMQREWTKNVHNLFKISPETYNYIKRVCMEGNPLTIVIVCGHTSNIVCGHRCNR